MNAANPTLLGGGGVDGAIHRKGGPRILEECQRIRRDQYPEGLPTGLAVATTAGDLPARWVIHTVGPVYHESSDPAGELTRCHHNALRVAAELGARTIAFPAISTGVYGYPMEEAAPVAVAAVRSSGVPIELVWFVLFDRDAYRSFERALRSGG